MSAFLTNFGLPGLDKVPYGVHICHFYPSREDLVGSLTSYFRAGLEHNEQCIWVTHSYLPIGEIALEIAVCPEMQRGLETGQLEIVDAAKWYGEPSDLRADDIVDRLVDNEERALKKGYDGLRITMNASFVPKRYWHHLMEYEQLLHGRIKDRRIVSCCSYHRHECRPVDMLEIVGHHHGALDRADKHWQMFIRQSLENFAG